MQCHRNQKHWQIQLKFYERISRGSRSVPLAESHWALGFGAFCALGRCHGDQLICDKIISGKFAHSIQMFRLCASRYGTGSDTGTLAQMQIQKRPDTDTVTDRPQRVYNLHLRATMVGWLVGWLAEWLDGRMTEWPCVEVGIESARRAYLGRSS